MLFVKYYEYDLTDCIYKIICEKFNACYPVDVDSMFFERNGEGVVIEIKKILSIEVIGKE